MKEYPEWMKHGLDINEGFDEKTFRTVHKCDYTVPKDMYPHIVHRMVETVVHGAAMKIMDELFKDKMGIKMMMQIKQEIKTRVFFELVKEAIQEMKEDDGK